MLNWMETLNLVLINITVEPILALSFIANAVCEIAMQNLNLEKACRVNLNYGKEVCDALSRRETENYLKEEQEVQILISQLTGYSKIFQAVLCGFLVLLWGAWSDRHSKRKPIILIPTIGCLMKSIGLLLCVYFENAPVEAAIGVQVIFPSITGGLVVLMTGIFSYLAQITEEKDRTVRIGIASVLYHVAYPIGASISGIFLRIVGFYGVFSLATVLYITCTLYCIWGVKEIKSLNEDEKKMSKCQTIIDFFKISDIKESLAIIFKKEANQRRFKICLLLIMVAFVNGPMIGEWTVIYLFTRYKFSWTELEFSLYMTYYTVLGTIGNALGVLILTKILNMRDPIIGAISSATKTVASVVFAVANHAWIFYIGAAIEMIHGTTMTSMRSIASKLVTTEELGRINSLIGAVDAFAPLIFAPIYTKVYATYLDSFPGSFFVITAITSLTASIAFLFLNLIQNKSSSRVQENTAL